MRIVAVADSDSYVKWASALLARMPSHWSTQLLVVRTTKMPSPAQFAAALAGSGRDASHAAVFEFDEMVTHVASERPDVVLVATIGPLADVVAEAVLAACQHRPVMMSGLPGIALPARRKALVYRSQIDLLLLHSKREMAVFETLAKAEGFTTEFGLARLPFMSAAGETPRDSTDVVFAAQAIVPRDRAERIRLLGWLVELARRAPEKRVVVKVRARAGEAQTHAEDDSYAELLAHEFPNATDNILVSTGPMVEHLASASALVTVSSTAALEAISMGIPVLALSEFGVSDELINQVFAGSGLLGPASELMDAVFHAPERSWLYENYFHAEQDNTWIPRLEALVDANLRGELAAKPRFVRGSGGALRRAWDRRRALGPYDSNPLGAIAVVLGTPARQVLLAWRELVAQADDEPSLRRTVQRVALDDAAAALPEGRDRAPRAR